MCFAVCMVVTMFLSPLAASAQELTMLEQINNIKIQITKIQELLNTYVEVSDVDILEITAVMQITAVAIDSAKNENKALPMVAGVSTSAVSDNLFIFVDGAALESAAANASSQKRAMELCESVAYDTRNMWKVVECVYEGDLLYSDTFIAG